MSNDWHNCYDCGRRLPGFLSSDGAAWCERCSGADDNTGWGDLAATPLPPAVSDGLTGDERLAAWAAANCAVRVPSSWAR